MPYIIDGHNLIPKIPGLSLSQLDDEAGLFFLLSEYFKHVRKKAVIFFDRAQHYEHDYRSAFVQAVFVHGPANADQAIIQYLKEKKKEAKNYSVISSDHWIITNAQKMGAKIISSENFAKQITSKRKSIRENKAQRQPNDIDYWMNIFKNDS